MSRTRRRSQTAITTREALEILASAVSYCQLAGLKVEAVNRRGTLALFIPGCSYILTDNGTRTDFRIGTPPAQSAKPEAVLSAQERTQ
jgi:hypothetical protein